MLKSVRFLLLPCLLAATLSTTQAVTVLADNFDDPDNTQLAGKLPDTGSTAWEQADSLVSIVGGQYSTVGNRREIYVNFISAPNAVMPQLYATLDVTLISHNGGISGFSLYDGTTAADERFFFGDRSGETTTWGVERSGGGPSGDATGYSGAHVVTFAYNFNTGLTELYDGAAATGVPLVSFTTTTGLGLNRFRGLNDGGGDYALADISVQVVPEPGALTLLGASLGMLAMRRRR